MFIRQLWVGAVIISVSSFTFANGESSRDFPIPGLPNSRSEIGFLHDFRNAVCKTKFINNNAGRSDWVTSPKK